MYVFGLLSKVPDDLSFIEDTHYTQVVCKEGATDCTEGNGRLQYYNAHVLYYYVGPG